MPAKRTASPKESASTANIGFEAKLWLAADKLRKDPRFLADFSKGLAREEILRSMEEAGLNKVAYAAQS